MNKALHTLLLTAFIISVLSCDNSLSTDTNKEETAPPTPNNDDAKDIEVEKSHLDVVLAPTNYPVRLGYINKVTHWWGDNIAVDLGTPGMAPAHDYNYMLLTFWKCQGDPLDIALLWQNAHSYFGDTTKLGSTNHEIQVALRKKFNDAGVKLLVSAFGATEHPTSAGEDPKECGHKLGSFIKNNNLDGADIDWEDNAAMEAGLGEQWLIEFTKALRDVVPDHIIIHAPQAPYFKEEYYKNGAYVTIDKAVGHLINFYMVQFYNQGNTQYNSYQELFTQATGHFSGTSVKEIAARGIPLQKIVVGKPLVQADAANTGFVCQKELGNWSEKAYNELGWYAGVGHWQYPSDKTGRAILLATSLLKAKCATEGNCK